jgi:polysaccharide export outer membrane protein
VRILRTSAVLAVLAAVGGCGLMPTSGPESWDVRAGQHDPQGLPYALVRVTPYVTSVLERVAPRLTKFAEQRRPKDITFGVGDVVSVTIFEAAAGGLFIPSEAGVRPGNFVSIPNQQVDTAGNISIPYAGNIRAKGRTPVEVQKAIVDALKNRAIEPQVVVSLISQNTSLITVLGDVGHPTRIPASAEGEHILDLIARAGGPVGPGPDEWVMLERAGQRALAPFGSLIDQPANNVWVHANDTIYLYREPQTYLAFGALGQQQQVPFGAWRLTLAEAIARAGGLNDNLADPASVFLYRGETHEVAQQLGVDTRPFASPLIPIIYNINLRNAGGVFLATNFEMRNKDVIFVSDSVSVESSKFMAYLNTINGTINDPLFTTINAYTARNLIQGVGSSSTAVITSNPASPSDIRLKRDITKLTELDNGLSLYRFRYLWSDIFYVGVMAQEVERVAPDAVVRGSDGYLRVNYARLGLRFMTWDEWLAAHDRAQPQATANVEAAAGSQRVALSPNAPAR